MLFLVLHVLMGITFLITLAMLLLIIEKIINLFFDFLLKMKIKRLLKTSYSFSGPDLLLKFNFFKKFLNKDVAVVKEGTIPLTVYKIVKLKNDTSSDHYISNINENHVINLDELAKKSTFAMTLKLANSDRIATLEQDYIRVDLKNESFLGYPN